MRFYGRNCSKKGSKNSINKLLRSTVISGLGEIDIFEELAFKVGSYGGTEINLTNEVKIPASDIKSSIPLFEFVNDFNTDDFIPKLNPSIPSFSILATATPITFPPLSMIGPPLLPLLRAASV